METLKDLLKKGREEKTFSVRKLAKLADIDQALISKFENGNRIPTKKQIQVLSQLLEIDLKSLLIAWYKVKLEHSFELNSFSIQAITEILQEKGIEIQSNKEKEISSILDEIEILKQKLTGLR